MRRVRDIVGFEITANEERSLDTLTKARNALQHYGLTETYEAVEALTAKVLDFLVRFLDESLFPDPLTANDEDLQDIAYVRAGANRLHTYVDQRLTRIGPTLAGLEERTVQCPRCFQETLVVEVDRTAKPPSCRAAASATRTGFPSRWPPSTTRSTTGGCSPTTSPSAPAVEAPMPSSGTSFAPATVSTPSPRTTAHTPLTAASPSVSSARPRYPAQLRQNLPSGLPQRRNSRTAERLKRPSAGIGPPPADCIAFL